MFKNFIKNDFFLTVNNEKHDFLFLKKRIIVSYFLKIIPSHSFKMLKE